MLIVLWIVIPTYGLPEALEPHISIEALSSESQTWFTLSVVITALILFGVGWWVRGILTVWRRRDLLPVVLGTHISDGVALVTRGGRVLWANEMGQQYLVSDGKLTQAAKTLLNRAISTRRAALQGAAIEETRITLQATPLQGVWLLTARPIAIEEGQREFYERYIQRIVHDMRNPLAAIIAHAGNLQMSNVGADTAQIIEKEAQRLTQLVDSVLFDARLSYVPLNTRPFDFADLVEEVIFQFEERAYHQQKTLLAETPHDGTPIEADYDLLMRSVANLVDNSLKYSKAGSTIRVTLTPEPNDYALRVIDNGDGIPPEYLPDRIWGALVRARPRSHDSGSGLGLSIVKKAVELHGGRVAIESTLGQGTMITLWLPR